jgi:hypothetical protein
MMDAAKGTPPFAPPFLKAGKLVIGQTANILLYLGPRVGLAPKQKRRACGASASTDHRGSCRRDSRHASSPRNVALL